MESFTSAYVSAGNTVFTKVTLPLPVTKKPLIPLVSNAKDPVCPLWNNLSMGSLAKACAI